MPATGTCSSVDDRAVAYGTGITGGWVAGWEPWVNTNLGPDGQRIGGWACVRTLLNDGRQNWMIAS